MDFRTNIKVLGENINKHSPSIMTALGVIGTISTAILASRATIKAYSILVEDIEPLDKFKQTWKLYLPAAVSGVGTIGCIIAVNQVHLERTAALTSLYSLTDIAFKEYQKKVVELVGSKKEDLLRGELSQDKLDQHPIGDREVIFTGNGDHLFFDVLSARYFRSDIETVRKIINDFNVELLTEMYKPLNDFYYELGLEATGMGNNLGWNVENGILDVKFSAKIAENSEPCIVIDYRIQPRFL